MTNIPKELGKTTESINFVFIHIGLPKTKQEVKPTKIEYSANGK